MSLVPRRAHLAPLPLVLVALACGAPADDAPPASDTGTPAAEARVSPSLDILGAEGLTYPVDAAEVASRFGITPPSTDGAEEVWCRMAWMPVPEGDSLLGMFTERGLVRVDVASGERTTVARVGIGTAAQEVRATYPSARATPHTYTEGEYLTVVDSTTAQALVFETDGSRVTRFRTGALPEAGWVEGCS